MVMIFADSVPWTFCVLWDIVFHFCPVCLFSSSALPCPPPPAKTAATEAQRKLCFPFLSRLIGAGFGRTCIARAGRWTARTWRGRWEAGWAGSGSQELGSAPALVVTPQTTQGWIPVDPSCLLTPGKPQPTKWGGRGTPSRRRWGSDHFGCLPWLFFLSLSFSGPSYWLLNWI